MPFSPSVPNLNSMINSYNDVASSSVYDFIQNDTESNWNSMNVLSQSWLTSNPFSVNGPRVLITMGDGTVCYDSASPTNTYNNYKSKSINENHNTRIAILTAMLSNAGIGYENRISSSTGKFTNYVAQRTSVTPFTSSAGCVRVSFNRPPA